MVDLKMCPQFTVGLTIIKQDLVDQLSAENLSKMFEVFCEFVTCFVGWWAGNLKLKDSF